MPPIFFDKKRFKKTEPTSNVIGSMTSRYPWDLTIYQIVRIYKLHKGYLSSWAN